MKDIYIEWIIIIAYMLFIFGKGVLKIKKVDNADDYLVAGRQAPWYLIFATLGATVIGGGASIGAVGKTYEWGMLMVFVSTGTFLHFIFSGLIVAPHFRRWELYTVAGFFGRRFDNKTRFLAFVLSLIFSVFIIAAQMAAFGSVLSTLFPRFADNATMIKWAIVIGGTMVVVYSTAGGILAVIYTDIYQFIILMGGFLITLAFITPDLLTSWGHVHNVVPDDFFKAVGDKTPLFLVTTFLAFLLGETFGPGYVTRYVIGKNIKHTKWGIAGVKIDFMAREDQEMVGFYERVARLAARHHLLVDFHGAYKPTGLSRTYPNLITREGVLGNENTKWSDRITPEHTVTLAFTRNILGEMDFTPGAWMNVTPSAFTTESEKGYPVVMSTRANQLAMFVVYESALQVICDAPYHYRESPAGLDFLKVVPVTWDETRVLNERIGDYITVARRSGKDWFIGSMTDGEARELDIALDFLGTGQFEATLWADAEDAAHYPEHLDRKSLVVDAGSTLNTKLAPGGGWAARIIPLGK